MSNEAFTADASEGKKGRADPDDEQYQKNLRRPAEVKEDIKQMSDRSRVSLILNSEAFRRELEEIVDEQLRQGNAPASLLALQQISNLLLPNHNAASYSSC
ncbi:ADD1-like protein [Mya arenaria]|uniref:ADD1-like protein n=1 Tax=Mya arenaria TaxID=6604 RepID=A0ABY7FHI5_MYAAR|nr:ADD1-like protein [Mya arenaria]